MGWAIIDVFSLALYTSGSGLEQRPSALITRIRRTVLELVAHSYAIQDVGDDTYKGSICTGFVGYFCRRDHRLAWRPGRQNSKDP